MGDGLKRNHTLTWGCRVDVIYDFCVPFSRNYLLHQLFFLGCRLGGSVFFMLLVICTRHLLVSNSITDYFEIHGIYYHELSIL